MLVDSSQQTNSYILKIGWINIPFEVEGASCIGLEGSSGMARDRAPGLPPFQFGVGGWVPGRFSLPSKMVLGALEKNHLSGKGFGCSPVCCSEQMA